jgi:uridylate kinase
LQYVQLIDESQAQQSNDEVAQVQVLAATVVVVVVGGGGEEWRNFAACTLALAPPPYPYVRKKKVLRTRCSQQ